MPAHIDTNVAIMRAFVKLRQILSSNAHLEKRIADLEIKFEGKFKMVFEAIRQLMSEHSIPRKRIIGLAK
jgi:hypothetical protein